MSIKRTLPLLACLFAATLLAACGKTNTGKSDAPSQGSAPQTATSEPAPTAAIDPCTLLGKAEAQTILGEPVGDAQRSKEVGFAPGARCSYFTSAPVETRGSKYEVYVEVYDPPTFDKDGSYFKTPADYYHRMHDSQTSASGPNAATDVSGVGDSAFWEPAPGTLNVLDRGVYVVVSVHADFHIPPGPSDKVDAEETAAAELKAATDLAKTVILPKLESLN